MSSDTLHPYATLTPDVVLDALDAAGLRGDGRILQLNSYENRVFQVHLEDGEVVVAKFYRPGRWTAAQILEEHDFALALAEAEIPVVPPLRLAGGQTLAKHAGFWWSASPRRGGRSPELDDPATLEWIGRFLGRIHAVGETRSFRERPVLDIHSFGEAPRAWLLAEGCVPPDVRPAWEEATARALEAVRACYAAAGDVKLLRVHGDCHVGNILWTEAGGPHFVDLDDARMAPAAQDLWMLLSGDRAAMTAQLSEVLAGYEAFRDFDRRELHLLEALRTLRQIHYSAWLARRWEDPAFPAAFPWFGTSAYWSEQVTRLREQVETMAQPPLVA